MEYNESISSRSEVLTSEKDEANEERGKGSTHCQRGDLGAWQGWQELDGEQLGQ
jgi:hypothetical protein